MRIFDILLERILNEGIEYIPYTSYDGYDKKSKVYTNATTETIVKLTIQAIKDQSLVGGVYTTDKNIILFDRDHLEHEDIINHYDIHGAKIGFYIGPRRNKSGSTDGWALTTSGFSTTSMSSKEAMELLKQDNRIQEAIKNISDLGYKYNPYDNEEEEPYAVYNHNWVIDADEDIEQQINEGIEYIEYTSDSGMKRKGKILTNVTSEKFLEMIKYAVDHRVSIGGIYNEDDNIILFDRTNIDHTDVIGHLNLYDSEKIAFYIFPRQWDKDPNGWYLIVSGWSSSMRAHQGIILLKNKKQIKEIIEMAEQSGYRYDEK